MFNKSEIMKHAWRLIRKNPNSRHPMRDRLHRALRSAWIAAKHAEALANRPTQALTAVQMRIHVIKCKARITASDWAELADLERGEAA